MPVEDGLEYLQTDAVSGAGTTFNQLLPDMLCRFCAQHLSGDLIDLGDAQLLKQVADLLRLVDQARFQVFAVVDLQVPEGRRQPGEVHYAQRDTSAFEDVFVAATALMQLQLTAAQAAQRKQRNDGTEQGQQAFTDEREEQCLAGFLQVEQAAQLPVAVGQRLHKDRLHLAVSGLIGVWQVFVKRAATADIFQQPGGLVIQIALACQRFEHVGPESQRPVALIAGAGLADEQVERRGARVVGIEVWVTLDDRMHLGQQADVTGLAVAVGADIPVAVEPDQAFHSWHGMTQAGQHCR